MIVELDSSFDGVVDWKKYQLALHNIFEAHKNGNHLFWASRSILNSIKKSEILGPVHLIVLIEILQKFEDFSGIRNLATTRLRVVDPELVGAALLAEPMTIDFSRLVEPEWLEPFEIVVENSKIDGDAFTLMVEAFAKRMKVPTASFKLKFVHGGGTTTKMIAEEKLANKAPFRVVVDSDRSCPTGVLGDTAKAIEKIFVGYCSIVKGFNGYSVLPCREIENLIPIEVVKFITNERKLPVDVSFLEDIASGWPICNQEDVKLLAYIETKAETNLDEVGLPEDEFQFRLKIKNKIKSSVLPKISDSLAKDIHDLSRDGEVFSRLYKLFIKSFGASPFFEEIRSDLEKMMMLSFRNPYRLRTTQ